MFVYEFRTYHINFIQNEHVKLDETYINIQGHFKENLLTVKDFLGRLTSKIHKTRHTAYIIYTNSLKYLITS